MTNQEAEHQAYIRRWRELSQYSDVYRLIALLMEENHKLREQLGQPTPKSADIGRALNFSWASRTPI
jgi:hypothetical protein